MENNNFKFVIIGSGNTTNHELIIKDFIDAVKENTDPFVNGESVKIASEVILDIYKNNII